MKNEDNYLSSENGVRIVKVSSQMQGCSAENLLENDKKTIWLSEEGLPQFVILDMREMKSKPSTNFKCFGVYCWHAYPTNPKLIELLISKDNINYNSLGNFDLILKPGTQFFYIEEVLKTMLNYLKIVVKEAHGGNRTYINNIFLLEEFPESESIIITDSRERNMPRKSETFTDRKVTVSHQKSEAEGDGVNLNNKKIEEEMPSDIHKKSINNYLISSDTANNFLLSDSELSIHVNERKNTNISADSNKKNNVTSYNQNKKHSTIHEEEEKSSYLKTKENVHSVKERITDREKDSELEFHLMQGYIKGKDGKDLREQNKNENSSNNSKFKANQSRVASNSKRNESNFQSHNNSINISHSDKRAQNTNRYSQSNYHDESESGHINYNALDNQIKEMQNQLEQLNFNTDKLEKFKKSISNKDYSVYNHDEYIDKLLNSHRGVTLERNKSSESTASPLMMSPHQNFNILSHYLQDDKVEESHNIIHKKEDQSVQENFQLEKENERINKIENKLLTIENDVTTLKIQMNKLTENIENLIETKNMLNQKNMNFILEECKKMINNNVNSYFNTNNNTSNINSNINTYSYIPNQNLNKPTMNSERMFSNTANNYTYSHFNQSPNNYYPEEENEDEEDQIKSDRENKIKFEKSLNKKLDEKFNSLVTKLEDRIYNSVLKPTVEKLENSLRSNLNEVMIHLKNAEKKKKFQQLKKSNEIKKCEKMKDNFEKLADKLNKKEKLIKEYEKQKKKGKNFSVSMNTFSDSFSDA